jgi:Iap family predicted aminopeptidase
MFRENAPSQVLSVMPAGRKGIFVQIVQINQLVDGRITVEARLEEVDDLHLEVVAAARMGTEKEAGILGG